MADRDDGPTMEEVKRVLSALRTLNAVVEGAAAREALLRIQDELSALRAAATERTFEDATGA